MRLRRKVRQAESFALLDTRIGRPQAQRRLMPPAVQSIGNIGVDASELAQRIDWHDHVGLDTPERIVIAGQRLRSGALIFGRYLRVGIAIARLVAGNEQIIQSLWPVLHKE